MSMQVPMEQHSREPEFLESAARLTMLSRLAGALAHEFRNPLTTIFLHADILEDALRRLESSQGPQLLHFLHVMREEVGRIDDLIQQYFLAGACRTSSVNQKTWACILTPLPWRCRHSWRPVASRWRWRARGLGQMSLHKQTFRRVLLHLLHNAVEAMPHGGVLRLCGQRLGQQLCLEVGDTGCGMPATQLRGLFQPLQTTKAGKLGLGLYVAHEIVTAHDGAIEVCSTPGAGTTVRLTFPVCPGSGPT